MAEVWALESDAAQKQRPTTTVKAGERDVKQMDLVTKVCPYVVMYILRAVSKLRSGERISFIVDDPLAIKSVPVELEEYDDLSVCVNQHSKGWEIIVSRA